MRTLQAEEDDWIGVCKRWIEIRSIMHQGQDITHLVAN